MLKKFRNKRVSKIIAIQLVFALIVEMLPLNLFALTGGPSQPEVQSFEPVNTSEMVDLFSGDFVYNIPLLDVGGYPINIAYHSGVTMDEEASWVGLGWNINPGVINRNMRGIPDDFKGDKIIKMTTMKDNNTFGVDLKTSIELFGIEIKGQDSILTGSLGFGINYNNYRGIGYSLGFSLNAGNALSLGVDFDKHSGVSITPSLSLNAISKQCENGSDIGIRTNLGIGFNSKSGLSNISLGLSCNESHKVTNEAVKKSSKDESKSSCNWFTGTFDFSHPSCSPTIMENSSFVGFYLNFKTGLSLWGSDGSTSFGGFFNSSFIVDKIRSIPSYGFLYKEFETQSSLRDLNREKEGTFSKFTKYLPVPVVTYDIYSVSSQAGGGIYKPVRGNVTMVSDPYVSTSSSPGDKFTLELNTNVVPSGKIGGNIVLTQGTSTVGPWTSGNAAYPYLKDIQKSVNNPYEPVFFKAAGDIHTIDPTYYQAVSGINAVCLPLDNSNDKNVRSVFKAKSGTLTSISSPIYVNNGQYKRETRNSHISFMNAEEATLFGLETKIKNYQIDTELWETSPYTEISRTAHAAQAHHISEMTVVNKDGSVSVYGIPAYNKTHNEYSFSVNTPSPVNGYVSSLPSGINTPSSEVGREKYVSVTKYPAYAHSYLLTAVLSYDYVDVTGDGPTLDDLGSYTKFNYSRVDEDYRWRTPYAGATHAEMMMWDDKDDKGSFVYGTKELWYLHSIETKTHVAIFKISDDRTDGCEALGEFQNIGSNPGVSTPRTYRLDQIILYNRSDYFESQTDAVPVKTVHFEYSQELCQNINNSSDEDGKLTLTGLWFTYGNNTKGVFNKYEFVYDTGKNISYDLHGYDRWGGYKDETGSLPNSRYPYIDQSELKDTLDKWASAWSLTSINLPSGGKINIDYESDDYAYVQNKKAMQMVLLEGTNPNNNIDSKLLYNANGSPCRRLYFEIPQDYTAQMVRDRYVGDMEKVYFNFKVNLVGTKYEYIAGYASISKGQNDIGIDESGAVKCGYITLESADGDNPVSKAAWQFMNLYAPQLKTNVSETFSSSNKKDLIFALIPFIGDIVSMFQGQDNYMKNLGFAQRFEPDESWIRLYNPVGKKYGGGSRVKEISMVDNWSDMTTNETNSTYSQTYTYETVRDGVTISSGVAAYEPMVGNDENPWRTPLTYTEKHALAPDNDFYVETPMGESYFPAASVGYSRVIVRNKTPQNITTRATGFTVHEFYTAFDFPVQIDNTTMFKGAPTQINQYNPFSFYHKRQNSATQGYVVILNDMHGKPKAQWVYSESNPTTPLSGVEYIYNTSGGKLNNLVDVVDKDGTVAQDRIGMDIEVFVDARHKYESSESINININVDGFLLGVIPLVIPVSYGVPSFSTTTVQTAVVMKVVQQTGLLKTVKAHQDGAVVSTSNLMYDKYTGDVLLTSVTNEFGNVMYSFTYPSHWMYNGMGHAFINQGITAGMDNQQGTYNNKYQFSSSLAGTFHPGDEIALKDNHRAMKGERFWILDVDETNRLISIIDREGEPFEHADPFTIQVIKSGRKNMLSANVGQVQTLNVSPFENNELKDEFHEVIAANATVYSDKWQKHLSRSFSSVVSQESQTYCVPNELGLAIINFLNQLLSEGKISQNNILPASDYSDFFSVFFPNCDLSDSDFEIELTSTSISFKALYSMNSIIEECGYYLNTSSNKCTEFLIIQTSTPLVLSSINKVLTIVDISGSSNFSVSSIVVLLNDDSNIFADVYIPDYDFTGECTDYEPILYNCNINEIIEYSCDTQFETGNNVNPFIEGIRGQWRPQASYVFYEKTGEPQRRVSEDVETQTNLNYTYIRTDGVIDTLAPYWEKPVSAGSPWGTYIDPFDPQDGSNWIWQSMVTKYDPFGAEIENVNALGIHSAALFGYLKTLPLAVSQNARYNEIGYEGFEDVHLWYTTEPCFASNSHWFAFSSSDAQKIVETEAHTGIYSFKLSENDYIQASKILFSEPSVPTESFREVFTTVDYDVLPELNLIAGKTYVSSFWVKTTLSELYGLQNPFRVQWLDNQQTLHNITLTTISDDIVVEGWRKIEVRFTVPDDQSLENLVFTFENPIVSDIYIDDLRIFPFNSAMQTYVYDAITYRVMAILDDNNFATFYEYDDEGNLVRVKKETARGIMTIQESRQNLYYKALP